MASIFPALFRPNTKLPLLCQRCTHVAVRVPVPRRLTSTIAAPAAAAARASSRGSSRGGARASWWARPFPDVSSRGAQYWLLGSAASVAGIVLLGGLTRLTESGLSITEWRPVTGAMPPRSEAEWEAEFAKYRATPEYAQTNRGMTADEFRRIYYMEWAHRAWGRAIGLGFVLPAIWLVARRRVSAPVAASLAGISGLIGLQGAVGWWMVRSGLDAHQLHERASPPRVSQYRLAVHLGLAFTCCGWMLATAMSIRRDRRLLQSQLHSTATLAAALSMRPVMRFRRAVVGLTGLVFMTVMSGALVAGLDAGLIYNEFPWMGTGLTPPASELWSSQYSRREDGADLWWRNLLENPSTVQLAHRILAVSTFCSIVALAVYARRGRGLGPALPRLARAHVQAAGAVVLTQVTLGICTLLWMVPVPVAVAHQAGSLTLFSILVLLAHQLRIPPSTVRKAQRLLAR